MQKADLIFTNEVLTQLDLIVGALIHEHQRVVLFIQVLKILLLERHTLDGVGRTESLI